MPLCWHIAFSPWFLGELRDWSGLGLRGIGAVTHAAGKISGSFNPTLAFLILVQGRLRPRCRHASLRE